MRVLLVSHAYQDGRYLSTLEAWCARENLDLTLVCPEVYQGQACENRPTAPFRQLALPISFGSRQGAFFYKQRALESAIDAVCPDLIYHEQEVYAVNATQLAFAARKRSIPLVMFVSENVRRSLAPPRRFLARSVLRRLDGLVTVSHGAENLHRHWGYLGPSCVIPQIGADIDPAPTFGRRDPRLLRVCFIGRLIPLKGIDTLLRSIALLRDRSVPVLCSIAGAGPYEKKLRKRVSEAKLDELVQFLGTLSEPAVHELLRKSDALVLPSRRSPHWEEQFGRVLPEAMGQATVTIGSKTGAIAEVIGDEELLFEEGAADQLASLLRRLSDDPERLTHFQKQLWQRARQMFTHEVLARRRADFLQQVITSSRSGSPGQIRR